MTKAILLLLILTLVVACTEISPEDPALADPALADPALADPALGDPALGDPALGGPGSEEPDQPEDLPEGIECISDRDCKTAGCSGTVCKSINAPPVITTCEFLPEYACYKETGCICINGECQWDETEEFQQCYEEKSAAST